MTSSDSTSDISTTGVSQTTQDISADTPPMEEPNESSSSTTSTTTTTNNQVLVDSSSVNDTRNNDDNKDNDDDDITNVTLVAKWGKERIALDNLSPQMTIGQVKSILAEQTRILPKRQKLVGLALASSSSSSSSRSGKRSLTDENTLSELQVKSRGGGGGSSTGSIKGKMNQGGTNIVTHQFILMGTPEEQIFVDPHEKDDLPDVIDDFELDFNAGSDEWLQHVANGQNLQKFTEATTIHIMNEPRDGKPLLVLDLDHTLLDFSSRQLQRASTHAVGDDSAAAMKRPYMDQFLTVAYQHYDLVVWSQTSWRWLETKLTELGMLTHAGYRFCFVLDKTSMFAITSTKRDGSKFSHHVKPLQIIWSKFSRWGSHNTVHIDDLERNFALNLGSGLKISAYYRKKSSARRDMELLGLARYLERLALECSNFDEVDFHLWLDVVSGKRTLKGDKKTG